MIQGQEKPGTTREVTGNEIVWLRSLLRYTRNIEVATNVPGSVPNITTLYNAVTFEYTGSLQLLFKSYSHTDHAQAILQEAEIAEGDGQLTLPNMALKVANTNSPEINLMMTGRAYEVIPAKVSEALLAYNAVRRLKGEVAKTLDPENEEDSPKTLFVVDILSAQTQGERFTGRGNPVGEGHPLVDIERLRGFDLLPPLRPEQPPPRTKEELFALLSQYSLTS